MKISSRILEERLREKGIQIQTCGNTELFIDGCYYPRGTISSELLGHKLLLFDEENREMLELLCTDETGVSEKESSSRGRGAFVYAVDPAGVDLRTELPAATAEIIEEFGEWRETVYEKMLEGENLQSIIDYMSEKVQNPFSLMDRNSFILGRSPGYESIPEGTIWDTLKGNYLNLYDFYSPREWKQIRHLISEAGRAPVLYHPENDRMHTYFTIALFDKEEIIGSIGAMDNNGSFTGGQLAIMEMIRDLMEVYFRTRYDASRSGKTITESFNRLINGVYDSNIIGKSLNKRHWHERDMYRLMTFDFPDVVASEIELTSIMNLIRMRYPKSMLGIRNKQIVLILREKDMDIESKAVRNSLLTFLKQYDLYCGISYSFNSFSDSRFYCEESAYAACCAVRNAENASIERCVFYDSVHMAHLLETVRKREELQRFCHPLIRMLQQSDKHSDRVLVRCLGAYLLHGKNISQTVQELQIHRNTLIYRLQRLEEILGIHFDTLTKEQTMGLLLSCEIAESLENV